MSIQQHQKERSEFGAFFLVRPIAMQSDRYDPQSIA